MSCSLYLVFLIVLRVVARACNNTNTFQKSTDTPVQLLNKALSNDLTLRVMQYDSVRKQVFSCLSAIFSRAAKDEQAHPALVRAFFVFLRRSNHSAETYTMGTTDLLSSKVTSLQHDH